jgi:hypothetical protein
MNGIPRRFAALVATMAFLFAAAWPAAAAPQQQSVDDYLSYIRRETDYVAIGTFDKLAQIGNEDAFEALKKSMSVLRTPSGKSRAFFAFRLFRGTGQQAAVIEFLHDSVMANKKGQGEYAMRALQEYGLEAKSELLVVVDKSKSASLRAAALKPMLPGWLERPTIAGLRMFLDHYRPSLSGSFRDSINFLHRVDEERAAPLFKEVLLSKRAHMHAKSLILQALAEAPDPAWEGVLIEALQAKEEGVQLQALLALEALESDKHADLLVKMCKSKLPDLRFNAYLARTRMVGQDETWLAEIRKMVKSKNSVDRQIAGMLAGMLPRDQAMEYLSLLLADSHLAVQTEALMALMQLRRPDSVPILIERLAVEQGAMKWRVEKALERMTTQPFGPSVESWRRWWKNEGKDYVLPSVAEAEDILLERDVWGDSGDTGGFYGMPIVSNRVAFILDTSGSMKAEYHTSYYEDLDETGAAKSDAEKSTRIKIAKRELVQSLEKLADNVHFNILFFDSSVRTWKKKLSKMSAGTRKDSIAFVNKQQAAGATAIFDALEAAFRDKEIDTIYVLSDGQPMGGKLNDPELIRKKVREWNRTRHITIHSISVGGEVALLIWLAEDSGGQYIQADG